MKELIGCECNVEFCGDRQTHPIKGGYPLRIIIDDVSMPLVKMREYWGGQTHWVNASTIKAIRCVAHNQQSAPKRGFISRLMLRCGLSSPTS